MLVLKLLGEEPKYGYQMIQEMKEKSQGVFALKDGTLYPILYRLEEEGLVKSKWLGSEGKQVPRKYYEMTPEGQAALTDITRTWESIAGGIARIMESK